MKNYDLGSGSNKKFNGEVSDNDIDEILEQDWLDEGDDLKCPIPSEPEGSGEPEEPIVDDVADSDGKEEQERPKIGGKFDISDLRVSQDYESIVVKKLITTIPVGKPSTQKFFRVNSDPDYQLQIAVIELKEENEFYLVHPSILPEISEEYKLKLLVVGVTRQGVLFVWPLGLPGPDGKDNPWHRSAREAAEHAETAWIKMVSNRELGAYEIFEAKGNLGEPKFPDFSIEEILDIAFKEKIIYDLNHPLLRQLRGEE